jgi:hypothetical protein
MRRTTLAHWGLLLLLAVLSLASQAIGQTVAGKVEMIGFDGYYRPATWTPMAVRLSLEGGSSPSGTFELRVSQKDSDGDVVLTQSRVTLTAGSGEQVFWTYFLPQPVLEKLPGMSRDELERVLKVTIHDTAGKELALLPIPAVLPRDVDPEFNINDPRPSRMLVLFVAENGAVSTSDFGNDRIVGQREGMVPVRVGVDRLPENVLGYDAVDAVVWLDGNPARLSESGSTRLDALREYVRRGGHLVICTPPLWQSLKEFGELLPVDIADASLKADTTVLRALVGRFSPQRDANNNVVGDTRGPWVRQVGTQLMTSRATAKPGALLETIKGSFEPANIVWPDTGAKTPWLVRRPVGYGCTSFVAQDLGNAALVRDAPWGWVYIWDAVLGTNNQTILDPTRRVMRNDTTEEQVKPWRASSFKDFGYTLLRYLDLTGRGTQLVAVAVLFFVGYWIIAGPVAFFVLRARGKAHYNWFAFGALAVLATLLTLGLVRLVLSGSPQVRHFSVVRTGVNAPAAFVRSRIGMYVPSDGTQSITVDRGDPTFQPVVSQFPRHDKWTDDSLLVRAPRTYTIDHNANANSDSKEPVRLDVFFRTTQKQLDARWGTKLPETRITGDVRLVPGRIPPAGVIANETGRDLRNVYIAWRNLRNEDYLMYVALWKAGDPLDLAALYDGGDTTTKVDGNNRKRLDVEAGQTNGAIPDEGQFARGPIADWGTYWFSRISSSGIVGEQTNYDDFGAGMPRSMPVMSLFGRIPPRSPRLNENWSRTEYLRSGARDLDVSASLLAGNLVVIANVDDQPLPMPLKVSGSEVTNASGRVLYQFVLPIDRSQLNATALQPTTRNVE